MMQIFKHKSHNVYQLKENLVLIRNIDKIRFYVLKAGLIKGFKGMHNLRFSINIGGFQWFSVIRLPFFYFEKNNGGFKIGMPNLYLWSKRA